MKFFSIYIISLLFITTFPLQYPHPSPLKYDLRVTVESIEEIRGSVRLCLVGNDKAKYLNDCDLFKIVQVESNSLSVTFDGIDKGIYCISVYHDVNDDGQLNKKGLFGIPSEPYGFSNNPKSFFGPPDFEKCIFELSNNKSIKIKL